MTNEEILAKYRQEDTQGIWGYMYGQPYVSVAGKGKRKDKIISISKDSLILGINTDCFIFVWGWPGPDANTYYFKDYGKTWAFTKEEIGNERKLIQ